MNEVPQSSGESSVHATGAAAAGGPLGLLIRAALYCALAGSVVVLGYLAFRASQELAAMKKGQDRLVSLHGVVRTPEKRLAAGFVDKSGRLLADPPTDPAKLLAPDTLVVAHYDGDDDDGTNVDWAAFQTHLAAATGKQVTQHEYLNSAEEVDAIKAGKIHVIALHSADVPYVVNNVGFIPVAVLGTTAGATGNHLVIAVTHDSKIRSLADIRGKRLTCTRPDSITGYRAAIAVLLQQTGMQPGVDYDIHYSHGQKRSITGLASGQFEVAALSDDKLQALLKDGSVEESKYRVIHESKVIPRLTLGYVYNLRPELAAKVTSAALEFDNAGGNADEASGQPMRFFAIDYQRDFEFVRKMDDYFDPRFGRKPKGFPLFEPASEAGE